MKHIVSSVELSITHADHIILQLILLDSYEAKHCYKLSNTYKWPILTSQLYPG